MSSQVEYIRKRTAAGFCFACGKKVEPDRVGKQLCLSCVKKKNDTERTRRIASGMTVRYWIPLWRGIYPNSDKNEILVTDIDGEVYTVDKRDIEIWEEVLDKNIYAAWRDLPDPYKGV